MSGLLADGLDHLKGLDGRLDIVDAEDGRPMEDRPCGGGGGAMQAVLGLRGVRDRADEAFAACPYQEAVTERGKVGQVTQ